MVVQDQYGLLGPDDLREVDGLGRLHLPESPTARTSNLVGRPLSDVERYYIEQALELTNGNREEAARMLGIGERTLYREIQEWKLQDKVRHGLAEANGDVAEAARRLGMKEPALQRKIKKWG